VIYVVDGTIVTNSADINLDDIDNVSVLSGPAAAALLGAQGANGAIIITTKKAGMIGSKSMGIELNLGFMASPVYIVPRLQNEYAGGDKSEMLKYTYRYGIDPVEWKPLDGKYYHSYASYRSWGPRMEGQEYIPWYAWYPGTKYTGKTAKLVPQPDNARDFYDVGMTYNTNISFDQTGDKYNIRAVIGNISVKGNIPTTSMNKTNFTLKTSFNITRKLTFAANINFFTTATQGDFGDSWSSQTSKELNQWMHRDLDMNIMRELRYLRSPVGTLNTWNHNDPTVYTPDNPQFFYGVASGSNWWFNLYTYLDYAKQYDRSEHLFGDISLNYKIIDGLDFKVTYRRDGNNSRGDFKFYSEIPEGFAEPWYDFNGQYGIWSNYLNRQNIETLLSFSKKFGAVSVNANAGSDFFRNTSGSSEIWTQGGFNIRDLFAVSNSKGQPWINVGRSGEKYRALFLRGDVGFRNLVFGEFTLRNDWFSTLPPENNAILSKSFGASFVFSDLLKLPWLSFGKLRASWGEIPASIAAYVYPGFSYEVNQYQWNGNFLMTTPDKIVDPKIHGDVKTQKEVGMELRFLKNRAGITATYWDGTERDIPYEVTISQYSGFSSKYLNTGKIIKQGLDIALNFKPLNMDKLTWDFNATFSWLIKNEVVSIADSINRYVVWSVWGTELSPSIVHAAGHPWGEMYAQGIKMYNGKPMLNADGSYADTLKNFGTILPKFTGGIQNTFRVFKNFTVIANFDYQFGGKYFSETEADGSFNGVTAWTSGVNDKGKPIRDPVDQGGGVHVSGVDAKTHEPVDYYIDSKTYFQSFDNVMIFDPFIHDLSYIKLRELSVGYDIPVEKMAGLKNYIRGIRISLVAQNLWLIYTENRSFDPSEISTQLGGEVAQFPSTRSFGANIKVNF
jgi:TonB-dependent SusC/RagA subfamily outer membrane receptor